MILSKFQVFNIYVKLTKHEGNSGLPIYAVMYARGARDNRTYVHHSISYTREQAFHIYERFVVILSYRYLCIPSCNVFKRKNYAN